MEEGSNDLASPGVDVSEAKETFEIRIRFFLGAGNSDFSSGEQLPFILCSCREEENSRETSIGRSTRPDQLCFCLVPFLRTSFCEDSSSETES